MLKNIYLIILSYFLLGGLGFVLINRKKEDAVKKQNWLKFATYFIIIHILFFSIIAEGLWFRMVSLLIILAGYFELWKVYRQSLFSGSTVFSRSMVLYLLLAVGFFAFGYLDQELMLFTFLILSVFDAFSQISGQLFGRIKLFPGISPNKTLEGLLGGLLFAFVSSLLLKGLFPSGMGIRYILTAGILLTAFLGDMLSSLFKRHYGVKDYSGWIPGHGGFLDRFDSLIAAGAFMALMNQILF